VGSYNSEEGILDEFRFQIPSPSFTFHWDGSHFLPAGAGKLRFSRFPAKFVGKKPFQPSREPTNSAGNVGSLLMAGSVNHPIGPSSHYHLPSLEAVEWN